MKRPESLGAVHTYTHTGNLINKKINKGRLYPFLKNDKNGCSLFVRF